MRTSRPIVSIQVTPPAGWIALNRIKKLLIVCLLAVFLLPTAVFGETETEHSGQDSFVPPAGWFSSVEELKDKRIGVVTGSCFDTVAAEQFPDAKILYFNNMADMLTALKSGKTDSSNLSIMLLKGAISTAEYTREEESDLPNQLVLHVRNEAYEKPGN